MHPESPTATGKHIRFLPGVNELSETDYNALMGIGKEFKDKAGNVMVDEKGKPLSIPHPLFMSFLNTRVPGQERYLTWIAGASPQDKEPKTVNEMTEDSALEVIDFTFSADLLNKWLEKAKNPNLIKAMKEQIEKLKLPDQKVA